MFLFPSATTSQSPHQPSVMPPLRSPCVATHHPSDPHTSPPSPSEHHHAKPWFPLPLAPPHMALPSPQSRRHPPPLQSPTRHHAPPLTVRPPPTLPMRHHPSSRRATTPPPSAPQATAQAHHSPNPTRLSSLPSHLKFPATATTAVCVLSGGQAPLCNHPPFSMSCPSKR
jgi:hypothetical protein